MRKLKEKWDNMGYYKQEAFKDRLFAVIIGLFVMICLISGIYTQSHTTKEITTIKGTVIDRQHWVTSELKSRSDGDDTVYYTKESDHYATQVKLENGDVFTDHTRYAYDKTMVNTETDVKMIQVYYKGQYKRTDYQVR